MKMIHNGIEYGMMQAMAEGFDILKNKASDKLPADERYELKMADIAAITHIPMVRAKRSSASPGVMTMGSVVSCENQMTVILRIMPTQ